MTSHRSFLVKLTAILCLITAVALKTAAADIHVTTTGNDSNAGTETAPLLTIHKAVEMVRAGYLKDGSQGKNGNGFKLGGGGSAGGAAFDQSVGVHGVTNCVAFENLHKGFDQNNAYEGMYIINCTAWGNEYNYRFPTLFKYGTMTIRNCIGWGALPADLAAVLTAPKAARRRRR